jgi:hypothetical protein
MSSGIALADGRISLGVDGTDKNSGHDEADQHIACIISAQEGIDEGIGDSRSDRCPYRAGDAHDGDDDQNQGQERRQVFAHPVHDVVLISSKEEAEMMKYTMTRGMNGADGILPWMPSWMAVAHVRGMETKVQTSISAASRILYVYFPT